MKKRPLLGALLLLLLVLVPAAAEGQRTKSVRLTLTGNDSANTVRISLSGDRSKYVIRVNSSVDTTKFCTHPSATQTNVLNCPIASINGIIVRGAGATTR